MRSMIERSRPRVLAHVKAVEAGAAVSLLVASADIVCHQCYHVCVVVFSGIIVPNVVIC